MRSILLFSLLTLVCCSRHITAATCDPTWTNFGDYCYQANSGSFNYYDAEAACVEHSAHLTSIHSDDENDFVTTLVEGTPNNVVAVWIGLQWATPIFGEQWTDHTAVDYHNYDAGQPSNADPVSQEASCIVIYPVTHTVSNPQAHKGNWSSIRCDDYYKVKNNVFGYVCKKPSAGLGGTTVGPPMMQGLHCPDNTWTYRTDDNRCLKRFTTQLTFPDAMTFCQTLAPKNYRPGLASIRDADDQALITNAAKLDGNDTWIGYKIFRKVAFWVDESPINYTNFAAAYVPPTSPIVYMKVFGDKSMQDFGQWHDGNTTALHNFVCEQWAQPPPTTTMGPTTEGATTGEPATPEPTSIAPGTHEPTSIAPGTHEPTSIAPGTHEPTSIAPETPEPTSIAPGTHEPTSIAPGTHEPTSIAPGTHEPTSIAPGTHEPTSIAPGTHEPTSTAPTSPPTRTTLPTQTPGSATTTKTATTKRPVTTQETPATTQKKPATTQKTQATTAKPADRTGSASSIAASCVVFTLSLMAKLLM